MTVIPIRDLGSRLPQAGRIRLGIKGTHRPQAIQFFRFTAPVADPLTKLANLYGGTVRPWSDSMSVDRFELRSEASEISVVLPPDPLDLGYEMWSKAGRARRCDGIECIINVPTEDGAEQRVVPCKCAEAGKLACKVKLRLNVLLPEVRGLGLWRLDSGSEYAAREMPKVVEALGALDQGRGMTKALLRIENRSRTIETKKGYQTRRFIVPVIDFAASFNEIVSGEANAMLGTGGPPARTPGVGPAGLPSPAAADPGSDSEIIEAEIVPDVEEWAETLDTKTRNHILALARKAADEVGDPIPTSFAAIRGETLAAIRRGLDDD